MTEFWDRVPADRSPPRLIDVLAGGEELLEVGIGQRTDVAAALSEAGVAVTAVDVVERAVPEGVAFVRDDVTDPDLSLYAERDAIYALRLPPDIQEPVADIADRVEIPLLFTTLGTDPPVIPHDVRTIQEGSLYVYEPGAAPGRSS